MMLSFHGTTFPYLFCLVVNAGLTRKNKSKLLTDVDGSQTDCISNRRFGPLRHGSPETDARQRESAHLPSEVCSPHTNGQSNRAVFLGSV